MDPHQVWEGELVNTLEARATIQSDPDRLEGRDKKNFVTNKESCKVLLMRKTSLGSEGHMSSSVGKAQGDDR